MDSSQSPALFGMLYIGEETERHVNLGTAGALPTDVYLCNAVTFLNSCKAASMQTRIVTNNKRHILDRLIHLNIDHDTADFIDLEFNRIVPPDIPFRSAHYKLDVFAYLGSRDAPGHSCLLDIDCVVLKQFSAPVTGLCLYDLSKQMIETNGLKYFTDDFSILDCTFDDKASWYGGEFVCGDRESFKALSAEIDSLWQPYLDNITKFNYIGDELLTSIAARNLKDTGQLIHSDGANLVARYWSIETLAEPHPLSDAANRCVLHLPTDKEYLARLAHHPFDAERFRLTYPHYVQNRCRRRFVRTVAKSIIKRRRHYQPRLT